ncbi:MAG: glycosyltransferase [Acidobacteria bacterium]|nr:MAG: glycosyltransferase [Acidobacteriota bacterium]
MMDGTRQLTIGVVIPTLDEEEEIAGCLDALRGNAGPLDVVVADGGSSDRTVELASRSPGVRVLCAERGRARQMNAGARAARGDVLWFLHADTRPGPACADAIRRAAARGARWGCFRFAVAGARLPDRILEAAVRLRTRLLHLPYGDQGLFVERTLFERVGGYPDWPLLEDVGLVRRLARKHPPALLPVPLPTSPRRYRRDGYISTIWRHQVVLAGFMLGRDPARLTRWRGPGRKQNIQEFRGGRERRERSSGLAARGHGR